jgi:hypothetical protein
MIKFIISATMRDGNKWETVRNSRGGMEIAVMDILDDNNVESFRVQDKSTVKSYKDEMDLLEKYPNAVEQLEILKKDYLGVN